MHIRQEHIVYIRRERDFLFHRDFKNSLFDLTQKQTVLLMQAKLGWAQVGSPSDSYHREGLPVSACVISTEFGPCVPTGPAAPSPWFSINSSQQ